VFARFVEEAQIGAQLQHPGIVPVYGLGLQPDGRPYFAMKLVKGRTLAELLRERRTPLDGRRRFLQIFEQACQTLAYAHARGVIHRDLKPSNFMVGSFGELQVVDWGFGKVLGREEPIAAREEAKTIVTTVRSAAEGSQSIAGSVMGTPAYMPPEQALGHIENLDARSDVFGLGAILCEVLTGEPAYTGSGQDILVKAAQANLDGAHARLDASEGASELVAAARRALSPVPGQRFRDAGELAGAVTDYLTAAEERARHAEVAAIEESARLEGERVQANWERRRKQRTRFASVAIVAVVTFAGVALLWADAERRARVAEVRPIVQEAMSEAARLGRTGHWGESLAFARKAVALAQDAEVAIRSRAAALLESTQAGKAAADMEAHQEDRDRMLLDVFDAARGAGAYVDHEGDDARLVAALAAYGHPERSLDPASLAEQLRARGIGGPIAAGLDEWVRRRKHIVPKKGRDWRPLLTAAMLADPEPWRNRIREAVREDDTEALRVIAREASGQELTPASAVLIAAALAHRPNGAEPVLSILLPVRDRHPEDFWLSFWSAVAADGNRDYESAIRFMTAALAIRPAATIAWANLAYYHLQLEDLEAAERAARHATRCDPDSALGHLILGAALKQLGRREEAIRSYRDAIASDARLAPAYCGLGNVHLDFGKIQEA
ncbi:MAG: serine/threonine-protein kinase, partial [Planctomycetota bacterium]